MNPRHSIRRLLAVLDTPAPQPRLSTKIGITALVLIAALDAVAALFASHMLFHACPIHLRRYPADGDLPVVCGLPNPFPEGDNDILRRARRGEIVLGECFAGRVAAVCPFCRWPTRLHDPTYVPSPLPLDNRLLGCLDANERAEIGLHAFQITRVSPAEVPDRITAALATESDVWIGTWYAGLHRYDRATRKWLAFEPARVPHGPHRTPGCRIKHIWKAGSAVHVEHADAEAPGYFRIHNTNDRGRTWIHGRAPQDAATPGAMAAKPDTSQK